jgi:hypothetical protein
MKTIKETIILTVLILLSNCAYTNMTSFRDPEFAGKNYHKLLVHAPFRDLELRAIMERAFENQFHGQNYIVPSMGIIMPTRSYTDDDLDKVFMENKIDGVLHVELTDAYSTQSYIPPSSSTHGFVSFSGNVAQYYQTTQQSGGYNISKPRAKFEIYLYDVSTKSIAWIATSLTSGNALADFGTLAGSLASETVSRLINDGLIKLIK